MISRTRPPPALAAAFFGAATILAACAPTVHVDVKPITIYAKLDADVRLRLDEDVKALIQQNPNLF
jgi:hypothetical protein